MKTKLFIIIVLLFNGYLSAQDTQWERIKKEDGIEVFARKEADGKYYVIKVITETRTKLSALVALLKDADNYTEWMHAAEESRLLKRYNKYEFSYYLHSDVPWPAQDRDVVIKTHIKQRDDKVIVTHSHNIKGEVAPKEDITRMKYLNASWKFTPIAGGKVKIIYQGKFRTHDYLPDWLQEEVYHIAPYNTIKNMCEVVSRPKYKHAIVEYIQN